MRAYFDYLKASPNHWGPMLLAVIAMALAITSLVIA